MQSQLSQLRLYQLTSPSLPIGSFTYSQGMEWAVENEWIHDPESLSLWLESLLDSSLTWLDLPILLRLLKACHADDSDQFAYWSQYLLACRETHELRQEEINRSRALLAVLNKLTDWPELKAWRPALLKSQISGFTLATKHWNIHEQEALNGYLWSWLENSVTVAVKLIPLGQSDGQIVLHSLCEKIPKLIEQATNIKDEEIGASTPALAIASSLHETQYTRLFRS